MAGVIDSFFAKLGFQVDATGLDKFQAKTTSLRSSILEIGALTTLVATGIGMAVMKVARGMDDVGDFADIAGLTARSVDALGKVAEMNDSSFAAMKASIQGIANVTGQAALGLGRGAKTFEMLGFEAKDATGKTKGAYDMLGEVADRMKDMSSEEKLAMASKLGIDASLIPLLSKGSAAFKQLKEDAEAANPLTDEQYIQADKIVKLWTKAVITAGMFTKMLAAKLFPVMERVLTAWNDLSKAGENATKSWVSAGLDIFVATLSTVWDWLGRIFTAGKSVFDWLVKFKVVTVAASIALGVLIAYQAGVFFIALGGAIMTAAKALLIFNSTAILPVAIIGALVIAVALLVDELVNFYEGNDSLIGQLSKDYPYALQIAQGALALVTAALVALKWQAITTVASMLASVASLAAGWIASFAGMAIATIAATWPLLLVVAAVAAIGYAIYKLWENWGDATALMGAAWALFTGLLQTAAKTAIDYVSGLFDKAKANVMAFIDGVTSAISKVGELLGMSGKNISLETATQGGNAMGDNSYGASPLEAAIAGASGMPSSMPTSGVLGRAANGATTTANTTTDTTNITGTVIHVTAPDSAKAGEAVQAAFQNQIKRSIRTGHSAKQL